MTSRVPIQLRCNVRLGRDESLLSLVPRSRVIGVVSPFRSRHFEVGVVGLCLAARSACVSPFWSSCASSALI